MKHTTTLDPLDIGERIAELKLLKHGWLDGEGVPPSHEGLDWLSTAFDRCYPDELPLPYLYPTAEGRVRAEWSICSHELSLEIDLRTHFGTWHSLDVSDDDEQSKVLNLNAAADWERVGEEVGRLADSHA